MLVYLCDPGHDKVTETSDTYPLGVANLAAYARANVQSSSKIEFQIFRSPNELSEAIQSTVPDVLGVSSYSWNHNLSLNFANYVKSLSPKTLTLMGGPNFPLTIAEQDSWMRTMPQIDVHVRGQTYEGEKAFVNLMQRYVDTGSIEGVLEEAVDGNQWVDPKSKEIIRGGEVSRIRNLDEIPSPYLAGYMDKFFDTGLFALLQIARGCPFTCQFCNSSVKSNSKAFRHSFERIKADLDYIVARINKASPLCFADDNFGMYKEDEQVADYIGSLIDKYDWPKYIRTTTGKNKSERIIKVMSSAKGRLPMTSSVQSLNPVVLKNIKRDNISLSTYTDVQKALHAKGMQSYGELILCMPGETLDSFMDAVDKLIETGVSRVAAHQLMLLHGAPLSNPESRDLFEFRTLTRIVARCVGKYNGEMAIETEEMVVESECFSFQDYLDARVFHLLLTIYYYEGNFEEAFKFNLEKGIRPFQVIQHMQKCLKQAPYEIKKLVSDYLEENQSELFETRKECVEWAEKNMEKLLEGDLGGNLLSKYAMHGRFFVFEESLDFLADTLKSLIDSNDAESIDQLASITDYYRTITLHSPFKEAFQKKPAWKTRYDVVKWREQKYDKPLSFFKLEHHTTYETIVEDRIRDTISSRLETFGEHPTGLGRFTRTMFANDFRRQLLSSDHRDQT